MLRKAIRTQGKLGKSETMTTWVHYREICATLVLCHRSMREFVRMLHVILPFTLNPPVARLTPTMLSDTYPQAIVLSIHLVRSFYKTHRYKGEAYKVDYSRQTYSQAISQMSTIDMLALVGGKRSRLLKITLRYNPETSTN